MCKKSLAIQDVFTYYASMSMRVLTFLIYGCLWMSMAQIQFHKWSHGGHRSQHGCITTLHDLKIISMRHHFLPILQGSDSLHINIYLQGVSEVFHLTTTVFFPMTLGDLGSMKKVRFHTITICALQGRTRTRAFFEIWISGLTVDPPKTLCQV